MVHLILVGTVHRDPEGQGKLIDLLQSEDPDCLTLEMSAYAVQFRREKGEILRERVLDLLDGLARESPDLAHQVAHNHPAIRALLAVLDFPYEYQAIAAFSASRNVPFYCIDRSDLSRRKISRLEKELITRENHRELLCLNPGELFGAVDQESRLALMALRWGKGVPYRTQDHREMSIRDRFMARRIRQVLASSPCRKLVHVGGWEHLVRDVKRQTLFTLLSDLGPERRLLAPRTERGKGPTLFPISGLVDVPHGNQQGPNSRRLEV